jgi:hypothetical protein
MTTIDTRPGTGGSELPKHPSFPADKFRRFINDLGTDSSDDISADLNIGRITRRPKFIPKVPLTATLDDLLDLPQDKGHLETIEYFTPVVNPSLGNHDFEPAKVVSFLVKKGKSEFKGFFAMGEYGDQLSVMIIDPTIDDKRTKLRIQTNHGNVTTTTIYNYQTGNIIDAEVTSKNQSGVTKTKKLEKTDNPLDRYGNPRDTKMGLTVQLDETPDNILLLRVPKHVNIKDVFKDVFHPDTLMSPFTSNASKDSSWINKDWLNSGEFQIGLTRNGKQVPLNL